MKKGRGLRWGLLSILALLIFAGAILYYRIDPLTEELAMAKINDVASNVINQAVATQIEEGSVQYEDLIRLQRDENGTITALTTNMREMNRLKTQLLGILDSDICNISEEEISIPIGNLTGIQLLGGRGPDIPVKIVAVSSSDADFRGDFTDAGINQTIHRIMMDVSLDLIVLLPSGTAASRVTTEVCVAETVLLGPVPSSYAYINTTGNEEGTNDDG